VPGRAVRRIRFEVGYPSAPTEKLGRQGGSATSTGGSPAGRAVSRKAMGRPLIRLGNPHTLAPEIDRGPVASFSAALSPRDPPRCSEGPSEPRRDRWT